MQRRVHPLVQDTQDIDAIGANILKIDRMDGRFDARVLVARADMPQMETTNAFGEFWTLDGGLQACCVGDPIHGQRDQRLITMLGGDTVPIFARLQNGGDIGACQL